MQSDMHKPLSRAFFSEPPEKVAARLLGHYLVRQIDDHYLVGKIVEVEAYLASNDQAAHASKGPTKRNKSLYMPGGTAYVHAMRQYCLIDVVTEDETTPSSVLIRAVEPLQGIANMMALSGTEQVEKLTNGPGKLCRAFAITREHDGLDLTSPASPLFLAQGDHPDTVQDIEKGTRIGITKETDLALRFYLKNNPYLSR